MTNDLSITASSTLSTRNGHRSLVVMSICSAFLLGAMAITASAQCGVSMADLYTRAAAAKRLPLSPSTDATLLRSDRIFENNGDNPNDSSIVGMWHTRFVISTPDGDLTIQEAFQIWNAGGTEVHNPNVDTRSSSVCLGVWNESRQKTYNLTHRVWNTDENGVNFGTLHLSEVVKLYDHSQTMRGTFYIGVYDPAGNKVGEVAGHVIGERINVGDQ